jgi:hypothetical protein
MQNLSTTQGPRFGPACSLIVNGLDSVTLTHDLVAVLDAFLGEADGHLFRGLDAQRPVDLKGPAFATPQPFISNPGVEIGLNLGGLLGQ